jgi:hypothetical protein
MATRTSVDVKKLKDLEDYYKERLEELKTKTDVPPPRGAAAL